MAITSLKKHDSHQVRIILTRGIGPHFAALRCVNCNKHIQWLNQTDVKNLEMAGVSIHTN